MADNPRVAVPIPTREQVFKDITDARTNLRAAGWLPPEQAGDDPISFARQAQSAGTSIDISGARNYQLSGDTRASDYARGLGKGFVDIVGALAGAVELTGIVPAGTLTKGIEEYGNEVVQNMSPSARKNLEREWTNLTNEGALRNPKAVLQQLTTVIPSLAVSMGGAGLAARAGVKGAQAAAKKAGTELTKKELQRVAATRGAIAGAGVEAPQISGATLNELRGAMEGMSHGELMQYSPEYAKAYKRQGGEAEARQEVLMKASRGPAAVNGILGAMIATVPGAVWGRVLTKTNAPTSLKRHLANTFGAEAMEEVSQEAIAGVTTGLAQQQYIDARHDPYSGMAERLAASFALGGLAGAAGGVLTAPGRNAERTTAPPRGAVDPAAETAAATALNVTPASEQINMEPNIEVPGEETLAQPMTGPYRDPRSVPMEGDPLQDPAVAEYQAERGQMALPLAGGMGGAPAPTVPVGGQYEMFPGESQYQPPTERVYDDAGYPLTTQPGTQGELQFDTPIPQMDMFSAPEEQGELYLSAGTTGLGQPQIDIDMTPQEVQQAVAEEFQQVLPLEFGGGTTLTGIDPDNMTVPEPIEDILAQIDEVFTEGSAKDSVYISPIDWDQGKTDPFWAARSERVKQAVVTKLQNLFADLDWDTQQDLVAEQFGINFNRVVSQGDLNFFADNNGGLVITTDPAKAKTYQESEQDDAARSELLEYPMSKEDLASPEATVTMEVVNPDGTVAETFVLENQPDIYNAVAEAYTARTGGRSGLREGQTVRVRPTGEALVERATRAADEFGNFIATDMQMGLPFAEGDSRLSTPVEPEVKETKRDRKAARKKAAELETKRRAAVTDATQEGIAAGIEQGIARETFEGAPAPTESDTLLDLRKKRGLAVEKLKSEWSDEDLQRWYKFLQMIDDKIELQLEQEGRAGLQRTPTGKIRQEIRELRKEIRQWAEIAADKSKSITERNAAIQQREGIAEQLQTAEDRLAGQIKAEKEGSLRQPDMFGGRGTLPEGTYQEVPYRTREGREKVSRMRPSQRGLSEASLLSEGGEEIRLDQPEQAPDKAPSKRKGRAPKQGELKFPAKGMAIKSDKKRADKQRVRTRGEVADEARQEEITAVAKAKLTSKRRTGGVKGNLRQVVEGGREQATRQQVRALEVLDRQGKKPAKAVPPQEGSSRQQLKEAKANLTEAEFKELTALIRTQRQGRAVEEAQEDAFTGETVSLDTGVEVTQISKADPLAANRSDRVSGETVVGQRDLRELPQEYIEEQRNERYKGDQSEVDIQQEVREKKRRQQEDAAIAEALDTAGVAASGTAGAGSSRETNLEGTTGGLRRATGPSITPRGTGNLRGVKEFLRKNFSDVLDNMSQDQLEGFAYMSERIIRADKDGDGTSVQINGDGAGVGKTRQLLALAKWVEFNGGKVLYVTPNKSIWKATVKEGIKSGLYPIKQDVKEQEARTDVTPTFKATGYDANLMRRYIDEPFDLIIFDEAHNLKNEDSKPYELAAQLKGRHIVYATATLGDKIDFLTLLANSAGAASTEAFISNLGGRLVRRINEYTGSLETSIEGVTPSFLNALKRKLRSVANTYGYFTRNLERLSTPTHVDVGGKGSKKIKGLNGRTPLEIERDLIASEIEREEKDGKKVNYSTLMTHSAKLSELHKVDYVVNDIVKRVKEGGQAIVFSHYFNDAASDKSKGKLTFTLDGKQHTYSLPSSLRLIKEALEEQGIKVGRQYGSSNTAAIDKFQKGEIQVILGTYDKMSEGISLDDQVGDTPRTQYHMIPDWSADVMTQARARADRANTQSVPNIFDLKNEEFFADDHREQTWALKDKMRQILIGNNIDIAYGPANIDEKPDGKKFKARFYGVPKQSSAYKETYKKMRRVWGEEDIYGYFTFDSEEDYKMNGRKLFQAALGRANKEAGLASGFEAREEATTVEPEKTDSVEGKATKVEAAEQDKIQPLMEEVFDLQQKAFAAQEVAAEWEPRTKGYAQAQRDSAVAWEAYREANERLIAEANRQAAAPAMLAPNTAKANEYAQQAWDAAEEGTPLTVRQFLKGMPKQGMNNSERRILRKLIQTVGDVPIRPTSIAEIEFRTKQTGAVAAYDQGANEILISPAAADFTESYVHEAIHAAAHYALDNSPQFRRQISKLIQQAGPALDGWLDTLPPDTKAQMMSALTDVHEFVSYGLSNPLLSLQLDGIVDRDRSLLRRIYEAIVSYLGVGRKSTLLDTLTRYSVSNFSNRVSNTPLQHGVDTAHAMLGAATMEGLAPMADAFRGSDTVTLGFRNNVRKLGLPMASLRQINTIYERLLDKIGVAVDGANPVAAWQDAMHKKEQVVKATTVIGEEMYNDLVRVLDAHPDPKKVHTLIHESTRLGIWANKPLTHKDNAHIVGDSVQEENHAELAAIYEGLKAVEKVVNPDAANTVYERLEKYYRDEREQNFDTAIANIFYGLNLKDADGKGGTVYYEAEDGIRAAVKTEESAKEYAKGIREGKYDPSDFLVVDQDGNTDQSISDALADGLRQNKKGVLHRGPYMPLKRFGKYGVRAKRAVQQHSVSLTAEDISKAEEAAKRLTAKKHKKDTKSAKAERFYQDALRRSKHRRLHRKLSELRDARTAEEPVVEMVDVVYEGDTATARTHVPYYSMHESREEGIKRRDELIAEGGWEDISKNVISLTDPQSQMLRSSNNILVEHLRSRIRSTGGDNAPALVTALESALISLMPETSVRHEAQRRVGAEGYFNDHARALAAHVQSGSWYRGQLEYGRKISEAMSGVYEAKRMLDQHDMGQEEATKAEQVLDEVVKRAALDSDPQNLGAGIQFMGDLGFIYMLFSPAYMAVNATQPAMIGLPWLKARQRDSGMSAGEAFTNAYKVLSGEMFSRAKEGSKGMFTGVNSQLFDFLERNLDNSGEVNLVAHLQTRIRDAAKDGKIRHAEGVISMLEELSKSNVMDFTMATDISSAASGRVNTRQNIMDRFRILPHLTEVLNRSVMAVSAYEMASEMPNMTHEQAVQFAERAVTETQFDYTMMNKPRWMSEQMWKGAKPVFMFMQHPQHIYALFVQSVILGVSGSRRHAARMKDGSYDPSNPEHVADERAFKENFGTLVGILGTHLLMGGAVGAMFEPVKWALGMALFAFEKITGEPPEETEVYVQRFMQEFLGDNLGEVASHGLPAAIGLHLSDSLAINNLALMNSPGRYGLDREGVKDLWFSVLGPMGALAGNMAEGVKTVTEGDVLGGVAKMSPRVARDMFKAADLYVDGLQDSRGNTIIDNGEFSPLELFTEAAGIRTRQKARAYENKAAIDNAKFFYVEKARRLKERLVRADGDRAATRRVVADIREFNKDVPRNMQVSASLSPSHQRRQQMLQELGAIVTREQEQMAMERRIWDD